MARWRTATSGANWVSIRAPAGATRRRIDFIRHDSSSRTPSGHRVRGRHPDRAALSPIPCYQCKSCSAALSRACEPAEILLINEPARRQQGAEQIAERQKAQDPDILEPMLAGAVNVQGVALSAGAIDPKLAGKAARRRTRDRCLPGRFRAASENAAYRREPVISMMYRHGYFRQRLDTSGWQHEYWIDVDP